jgi:hypothetical protein
MSQKTKINDDPLNGSMPKSSNELKKNNYINLQVTKLSFQYNLPHSFPTAKDDA